MPSMKSRIAAYRARVDRAHRAFMSGDDGRDFDNCFEMYDGEFVVVALMRRAEKDIELMAAIRRQFSLTRLEDWSWVKTAARHSHVSDAKLPSMAAQAQIEAEWHSVNIFMPQLQARREEGACPFVVIRKEGPEESEETLYGTSVRAVMNLVRSWHDRTIKGASFLSLLATIQILTPEGELHAV